VLLTASCSHRLEKITIYNRLLLNEVECLALAPFENLPDNPQADQILAELLLQSSLNHPDWSLMQPDAAMIQNFNQSRSKQWAQNPADLLDFGKKLKVHAVLAGKVIAYDYQRQPTQERLPLVTLEVRLFHIPTGELIWSLELKRQSESVGRQHRDPLSRVAMLTVEELWQGLQASQQRPRGERERALCASLEQY